MGQTACSPHGSSPRDHVVEISRSTRMSLINGVPLNQDTLSVNDKFFPTIKGKRKPAQAHLSFRGRNDRGFRQVEVVLRRRENRDPVARVQRERERGREEAWDNANFLRSDRRVSIDQKWSRTTSRGNVVLSSETCPSSIVRASFRFDGRTWRTRNFK